MTATPEPDVVAAALAELADTVKHIIAHGRDAFMGMSADSRLLYLASCQVIIRLQTMIEDLPQETLSSCPDLPLAEVRGMRNRLAHGYLDIDLAMLWETMSHEVVPLIESLIDRINAR